MAEDKIDDLIRQLASSDDDVSRSAEYALVKIGRPAVRALIDLLKMDNEGHVRWKAVGVLIKLVKTGDVRTVPALIKTLKDKNADVRVNAVWALGEIRDAKAVPALIKALKDKNANVRWEAATAFIKISDVRAVPALINALNDGDVRVRGNASTALVEIGKPAVPALIDAMEDVAVVREMAAWALGEIKDAEAVPVLVNTLKNDTVRMQIHAALALGKMKDTRAVPALVDALRSEDNKVLGRAAEALDKIIRGLTEIQLVEFKKAESVFRKALEKAEGKETKEVLVDLLETINKRQNEILEPEAKKLKPPKRIKRKGKPKRRLWRAVQG